MDLIIHEDWEDIMETCEISRDIDSALVANLVFPWRKMYAMWALPVYEGALAKSLHITIPFTVRAMVPCNLASG